MPVYDFLTTVTATPKVGHPHQGLEPRPMIQTHPVALSQLSDVESGLTDITGDAIGVHPDYIEDHDRQGFRYLDSAMKAYWSGIQIPTKDAVKPLRVKIAGGDKSIMAWQDSIRDGRVALPVASLNRVSAEFDKTRFSPPYHPMAVRHLSARRNMAALIRRPAPYLVEYEMIVWAEWKKDAECILDQILTRFNMTACFRTEDGHLHGEVILHHRGWTDASDKEIGADQKAKVRYEFRMSAEAWLSLPDVVVPTVLGRVTSLRESLPSTLREDF